MVYLFSPLIGDFDAALVTYDRILSENPANILAMKRKVPSNDNSTQSLLFFINCFQVAVYKSQSFLTETVSELNQILKQFPSDTGSWIELAELHAGPLGDFAVSPSSIFT
jgi:hypothetical protein